MSQDSLILAADGSRLPVNGLDYLILAIYFAVVIGIGIMARRAITTSEDFFLSGRSLPAWITGLAFISANLGAIEILGMAANGAQYGVATVHFYWIGAVPAMVFLGLVMMPFYYGSRVHSVPEYLRRRFNNPTHLFNALTFAARLGAHRRGQPVRAGTGHRERCSAGRSGCRSSSRPASCSPTSPSAGCPARSTTRCCSSSSSSPASSRSSSSACPRSAAGSGLKDKIDLLAAQRGGAVQPVGRHAVGIRPTRSATGSASSSASASCSPSATGRRTSPRCSARCRPRTCPPAQRTPLIGAYPKIFIPSLTIIPGLIAAGAGAEPRQGRHGHRRARNPTYNDAIPRLMGLLLPNGVLGIAVTGLLAAFMAGMAANVSSFNTVFTYDIWRPYVRPGPARRVLPAGRAIRDRRRRADRHRHGVHRLRLLATS